MEVQMKATGKMLDIAIQGVHEFLNKRSVPADQINLEALVHLLAKEVAAALPQAIVDYMEAKDCGMDEAALMTFKLTMKLAGVRTARIYLGEIPCPVCQGKGSPDGEDMERKRTLCALTARHSRCPQQK